MTREEFLKRLNVEAAQHYGLDEISDGILDDWLEANIVQAPPKQGQTRTWTEVEFDKAVKALRFKSLGVTILGEIRFHLWLDDSEIPLFESNFDVRGILIREFSVLRNQLTKPIRSTYPQNQDPSPGGWPAKSVLRGMGELDPTLKPFIEYEPAELLDAYTLTRFGDSKGNFAKAISRLCLSVSNRLISGLFGKMVLSAAIKAIKLQMSGAANFLRLSFAGSLRPSSGSENPIEKSIRSASEADFLLARRALNGCTFIFGWLGLQKVSNSLRHPKWQTALFVLYLHMIHRGWGKTVGMTPQDLDLLEEMARNNPINSAN